MVQNENKEIIWENYTGQEEQKIVAFLKDRLKNEKDNCALAVLTVLFTGLPINVVTELRWEDFVKIPYSDNYQLIINKRTGDNSETVWLTSEEECRRIPIALVLAVWLNKYKKIIKGNKTNKEIKKQKIFFPDATKIPDIFFQSYIQAEENAGIERGASIYNNNQNDSNNLATALSKYIEARITDNFLCRCQTTCQMTEAETEYLMRKKISDLFAAHYCDYGHECIQHRMAVKLNRWGRKYMNFAESDKDIEVKNQPTVTIKAMPQNDGNAAVQFDIRAQGPVKIVAEAAHEVHYDILVKEEKS